MEAFELPGEVRLARLEIAYSSDDDLVLRSDVEYPLPIASAPSLLSS